MPVAAVTAISVQRGRMLDAPRPVLLRPAAMMQAVVAVRALVRPAEGGQSRAGRPESMIRLADHRPAR
jgi:hypothetical protein